MTELPRIVSVDDHVIEPAHLFETWLPAKYRDRGPQPLTAGIGELAYIARQVPDHHGPRRPARPTGGSTRTSSSRTSATSPPSASTATT